MTKKNNELMLDFYKENQNFLNKVILSVSSLAIPLLFTALSGGSFSGCAALFLILSFFGFILAILLEVISLNIARTGCDKSMSEETEGEGWRLFVWVRRLDVWRDLIFVLSFVFVAVSLSLKLYYGELM